MKEINQKKLLFSAVVVAALIGISGIGTQRVLAFGDWGGIGVGDGDGDWGHGWHGAGWDGGWHHHWGLDLGEGGWHHHPWNDGLGGGEGQGLFGGIGHLLGIGGSDYNNQGLYQPQLWGDNPYQSGWDHGVADSQYDHIHSLVYNNEPSCDSCHTPVYLDGFHKGYDAQWNTYQSQDQNSQQTVKNSVTVINSPGAYVNINDRQNTNQDQNQDQGTGTDPGQGP